MGEKRVLKLESFDTDGAAARKRSRVAQSLDPRERLGMRLDPPATDITDWATTIPTFAQFKARVPVSGLCLRVLDPHATHIGDRVGGTSTSRT